MGAVGAGQITAIEQLSARQQQSLVGGPLPQKPDLSVRKSIHLADLPQRRMTRLEHQAGDPDADEDEAAPMRRDARDQGPDPHREAAFCP